MKQNMRVVGHAIDSNRGHFLIAADAGQIRPELRLHIFGYGGLTIFGAEDEMDVIFDERVRHGCAALSGLRLYISLSHRLPVSIQQSAVSIQPRTKTEQRGVCPGVFARIKCARPATI